MVLDARKREDTGHQETTLKLPENLPNLFTLHEQVVMRTPIDISEVFSTDPEQTVAFEVALAALVATALLTTSISVQYLNSAAVVAAMLLLGLTLFRKMLLDNTVIDSDGFMKQTTSWLQYLIIFSVAFTGLSFSESMAAVLPGEVLIFQAVGLFLFSSGLLIAYEFVLGDLFFWAAVHIHNQGIKGESIIHEWMIARAAWAHRGAPRYADFDVTDPAVRKVRFQSNGVLGPIAHRFTSSLFLVMLSSLVISSVVIVGPLLFVVSDHPVWYVAILNVLLALSAYFLLVLSQFVLSRYGNATFEDVAGFRENVVAMGIMLGMTMAYQVGMAGLPFV